jgi:hypothetical protein
VHQPCGRAQRMDFDIEPAVLSSGAAQHRSAGNRR